MKPILILASPFLFAAAMACAQAPATLADCDAAAPFTVLHGATSSASDARAVWLDHASLLWPSRPANAAYRLHAARDGGITARRGERVSGAQRSVVLAAAAAALDEAGRARFGYLGAGVKLSVPPDAASELDALRRGELLVTQEDAQGRVVAATATQIAAALDQRFAAAEQVPDLGAHAAKGGAMFKLWAPTARNVALCLYPDGVAPAAVVHSMQRDDVTGVWWVRQAGSLGGRYYTYLVDVFVRGVGVVRNRVTDPYALGLSADSNRSWVTDLDAPSLMPKGWAAHRAPQRLEAQTDQVIYELHVRDFSVSDASVPAALRGKYGAFALAGSAGMRHLRALSDAGVTDVHLLPVFDFATVPEMACITPVVAGAPDGETQQAAVQAARAGDCYNWGYDPLHFTAPEGSYASDAMDAAVRIREFRAMVQALHGIGLRVGMDVVYNHTSAAGQSPRSVLDRVVPGYYQRLAPDGAVETSTCCQNTATEHRMMAKLMIDSAVVWARDYRIDSFRFDLMGHQPREAMQRLKRAVEQATGREIQLLGEGWNFGEVANGARFVQASQLSLQGSGIATFSDRARDAVRGGGPGDGDARQVSAQGFINGLGYDRNAMAPAPDAVALMRSADLVRVGLAGSLSDYVMRDFRDREVRLAAVDYNGQPAGYVREPAEVVNYVENHDNQTLFDLNAFKLPVATSREDRARVQVLGGAVVAFSQGIAYLHAGIDTLRSKSMDRNSYDSGDWFNRIDWTYRDNGFGSGLPPSNDNASSWQLMRPRLADPGIRPEPAQIAWTRDAFLDLLRIRASSHLFRLRSTADVRQRLGFPNTGSQQIPTVMAGRLDGSGDPDGGFAAILYFINVDKIAHQLVLPQERARGWRLHPVHLADAAADRRPRDEARYDAASGRFTLPARTALVFVIPQA